MLRKVYRKLDKRSRSTLSAKKYGARSPEVQHYHRIKYCCLRKYICKPYTILSLFFHYIRQLKNSVVLMLLFLWFETLFRKQYLLIFCQSTSGLWIIHIPLQQKIHTVKMLKVILQKYSSLQLKLGYRTYYLQMSWCTSRCTVSGSYMFITTDSASCVTAGIHFCVL